MTMRQFIRHTVCSVLLLAATAASTAVNAQEALPPEIEQLQRYIFTEGYQQELRQLVLSGERQVAPECASTVEKWIGLQVIRQPEFGVEPFPIVGAWRDQIKVKRCKENIVYNVLVVAHPNQKPTTSLLVPGDSALPPKLQRDVLEEIDRNLAAATSCPEGFTAPRLTQITKKLTPITRNREGIILEGKWTEHWIAQRCGKIQGYDVEITADGTGGAKVHVVPPPAPKAEEPAKNAKKKK